MASLREIKDHIGSVRSTLKITSAMKLVSSAKLRKAQQAVETMRPYQQELEKMLSALGGTGGDSAAPEMEAKGKLAIVAIASNSSLCGAFNGNVLRKVLELVAQAGGPDCVEVFALGRKVAEPLRKAGIIADADRQSLNDLVAHPDYGASQTLASALVDGFDSGRFSSVLLVYNHFVSTSTQKVVVESYLPPCGEVGLPPEGRATRGTEAGGPSSDGGVSPKGELPKGERPPRDQVDDYILEPGREAILADLLPQVIRLKLYAAILDSVAAEHAARMIAMQAATDNAEDLLAELSLEYNKGRQAKITAEILDLVAGARQ